MNTDLIDNGIETGNLMPLLHEIRHALLALESSGVEHLIDLGAVPFAPTELEKLDQFLGSGEVQAEVEALGRSTVRETRFPGVWYVTHYDNAANVMGQQVEITEMPILLRAQVEDIHNGRLLLDRELAENPTNR